MPGLLFQFLFLASNLSGATESFQVREFLPLGVYQGTALDGQPCTLEVSSESVSLSVPGQFRDYPVRLSMALSQANPSEYQFFHIGNRISTIRGYVDHSFAGDMPRVDILSLVRLGPHLARVFIYNSSKAETQFALLTCSIIL